MRVLRKLANFFGAVFGQNVSPHRWIVVATLLLVLGIAGVFPVASQEVPPVPLVRQRPYVITHFRDDFRGSIDMHWHSWTANPVPSNVSADSPVSDTGAEDDSVVRLKLSAGDSFYGPTGGMNLYSRERVHFGRFSARIKTPAAPPSIGMVTGFFFYFNDVHLNPLNPLDENNNNIADNSEIDIELLSAQPHYIWMTIWTDHQCGVGFRRVSRSINMRTGAILQVPEGREGAWGGMIDPGYLFPYTIPDFDHTQRFYEYSFYWSENSVRFYVKDGTREILLWEFTDPNRIPTHPARFMLNLWHNKGHWHDGSPADPPLQDAFLKIDWAEYSATHSSVD